jgi:hypothetical protein
MFFLNSLFSASEWPNKFQINTGCSEDFLELIQGDPVEIQGDPMEIQGGQKYQIKMFYNFLQNCQNLGLFGSDHSQINTGCQENDFEVIQGDSMNNRLLQNSKIFNFRENCSN